MLRLKPYKVNVMLEVKGKCDSQFAQWFGYQIVTMLENMPQKLRSDMDIEEIKLVGLQRIND